MGISPDLRGEVAHFCNMSWIIKLPFLRSTDKDRGAFVVDARVELEMASFPSTERVVHISEDNTRMYFARNRFFCQLAVRVPILIHYR